MLVHYGRRTVKDASPEADRQNSADLSLHQSAGLFLALLTRMTTQKAVQGGIGPCLRQSKEKVDLCLKAI
jgi:hypothetical protein